MVVVGFSVPKIGGNEAVLIQFHERSLQIDGKVPSCDMEDWKSDGKGSNLTPSQTCQIFLYIGWWDNSSATRKNAGLQNKTHICKKKKKKKKET